MKVNRRTQAERTAATRASLIGAGRKLFGERGFADVGTQEIVAEAGVTRGALYHQFDDKKGLFVAVYDDVEQSIVAQIAAAVGERAGEDPLAAPDALRVLALDKTAARLEQWARASRIDLDTEWRSGGRRLPSLRRIADETAAIAAATDPLPGVMHGDLCFPNTFFDFRQQ